MHLSAKLPNPYGDHTKFWQLLAILVIAAGIWLRCMIWWQQRPIYLDEANLIRNYVERSYAGLFQDLDYEQYAPPLFSVIMKASIDLFGNNELSTRLFPMLCSIFTLLLFYRLSRRFLSLPATVAALLFVSLGKIFIDYATACKQYATDGLVTLLLLELAFRLDPPKGANRSTFIWIFIGVFATWLSMPSVFALAGIGLYWLVQNRKTKAQPAIWGIILTGGCWLISFGIYFMLLLRHNAQSDYLQNYHNDYFLAFPPKNLAEFQLLLNQLGRIVSKAIGKTALAKIMTTIALLASFYTLRKYRSETRQQTLLWLILMPVLFCLAASALRYYSLLTRLTLFFLPLVILLVFFGLQILTKKRFALPVITILMLIVLGNQQYLTEVNKPFHGDIAEIRNGLWYIAKEQQPGEIIIASDDVLPVMRYYTLYRQPPLPLHNTDLQKLGYGKNVSIKLDSLRNLGYRKVWLVASIFDKSFGEVVSRKNRVLKRKDDFSSYVVLYKL